MIVIFFVGVLMFALGFKLNLNKKDVEWWKLLAEERFNLFENQKRTNCQLAMKCRRLDNLLEEQGSHSAIKKGLFDLFDKEQSKNARLLRENNWMKKELNVGRSCNYVLIGNPLIHFGKEQFNEN